MPPDLGVVLYGHGTVDDLADLPAFLQRIRRGRPPPPGLLEELRHRYQRIGGSPLLEVTRAQAAALEARLGCPTWVAMRLWRPELAPALREAAARGVTRLVILPMAPYSGRVYAAAADATAGELGAAGEPVPALLHTGAWGDTSALIAAHAASLAAAEPGADPVVLTAHSLPLVALAAGDSYAAEVERAARAVGAALGREVDLAYQSQGADGGAWLGPTLRERLDHHAAAGARRVVVAPFGFLAEHVETLYDLDVEARAWAEERGLAFTRVPALDARPGLVEALVEVVRRTVAA